VKRMPRGNVVENPYVKCPYYKYERQAVIYCEGAEQGSCIHMAFAAGTRRKEYKKQFCENCWHTCMVADAHNRKWDYAVS